MPAGSPDARATVTPPVRPNDAGSPDSAPVPADAPPGPSLCATGGPGWDTSSPEVALDGTTCLAWQRLDPERDVSACPLQIRDDPSKLCWSEAIKYCAGLRLEGKSDWRLPALAELETLVVPANSPAFDKAVFPSAIRSIYWSVEKLGEKIVAVDFSNRGMVNDHIGPDGPQALRCVRGPFPIRRPMARRGR
jgi:hypothetical protein